MTAFVRNHVIIIDGTQSGLKPGMETNAGLLFKLLDEARDPKQTLLYYDAGIQGHSFWNWVRIASGLGIAHKIRDAYGMLARNYRLGDRIFLFGYSRGAYAVRSVAGMMAQLGLLRADCFDDDMLARAFGHYERQTAPSQLVRFRHAYCHEAVKIDMIGVWDTVKALGLPYPLLSRLAPMSTEFHNHRISPQVKSAYHALSLDETGRAFSPVLWKAPATWDGHMQQVWFKGAHSDVGGQVETMPQARGLSNITLNWILDKVDKAGLDLPAQWQKRFPENKNAQAVGSYGGIAKFFLFRAKRVVGKTAHEYLHPSLRDDFSDPPCPFVEL